MTPVFEASDELWHYPMVRHLADGNPLPVQVFDPAAAGPWKQEASQPPLYYYLGAALTFWIDAADMERVRWLNPHANNGVITADGNINLVVHDPAADPWQGTLLAVRIIRIFSVLLGAATVYLTYRIAREVAPGRPEIALGAAAVNAFTPMFLFISGAVNNDSLVIPLASLALLLMIKMVRGGIADQRGSVRQALLLGVVIGLGTLTKITAVGLLPLALGTVVVAQWPALTGSGQERPASWGRLLGRLVLRSLLHFAVVLAAGLLIAGWWYFRNIRLYGDWSGWNAFIAVLGQRAHPASLVQLWSERWGFMLSYWGLFGGVNVPMTTWIYHVLNAAVVLAVPGFIAYLAVSYQPSALSTQSSVLSPQSSVLSTHRSSLIAHCSLLITHYFPLLLCLLWSAAVVVGLVRWATVTWSSQGRLVFSAISTLSVLLVVGLVGWLPRRPAGYVVGGLALFMLAVSAVAPLVWIRPAYQPERWAGREAAASSELVGGLVNVTFGDHMRLVEYQVEPAARPGEAVNVFLRWQVLAEMERDWSVFVHLNDPVLELPVAQRDMYPGQGLLATRLLAPGQEITNYYQLQVPGTAVAPTALELTVGLYDFYTRERLSTEDGRDAVVLTTVALEAAPGELPNPTQVNFGDELELAGFEMAPRRVRPGESIALTLYWRVQRPLETNYTFFAQVVGEDTTRWASQDLAPPLGTVEWAAGEVQEMHLALVVSEETPAGVYPLIIGAYTRPAEGVFDRLQIMTPEGRPTDDFLILTQVRVD